MQQIGSMLIAVLLALVGICPIDFTTKTFEPVDLIILVGCLILWGIICHIAKKKA